MAETSDNELQDRGQGSEYRNRGPGSWRLGAEQADRGLEFLLRGNKGHAAKSPPCDLWLIFATSTVDWSPSLLNWIDPLPCAWPVLRRQPPGLEFHLWMSTQILISSVLVFT